MAILKGAPLLMASSTEADGLGGPSEETEEAGGLGLLVGLVEGYHKILDDVAGQTAWCVRVMVIVAASTSEAARTTRRKRRCIINCFRALHLEPSSSS